MNTSMTSQSTESQLLTSETDDSRLHEKRLRSIRRRGTRSLEHCLREAARSRLCYVLYFTAGNHIHSNVVIASVKEA